MFLTRSVFIILLLFSHATVYAQTECKDPQAKLQPLPSDTLTTVENLAVAEDDAPVEHVFYVRQAFYKNSSPLTTANFLDRRRFNFGMRTELGANMGESDDSGLSAIYKLQAESPRLNNHYSLTGRFSQKHTLNGSLEPETATLVSANGNWNLSDRVGLQTTAGGVYRSSTGYGAAYLVRVQYRKSRLKNDYEFTLANFDVFDVYPVNTPFVQIQKEMSLTKDEKLRIYGYLRYRFQNELTNYNATYLAIGLIF